MAVVTKVNILLLVLVAVLFALTLFFPGCNSNNNNIELLGKAQIVLFQQGEKTILDPQSPYHKQLQATCEEMLINSELLSLDPEEIINIPSPEEIKNEGWAIELIYDQSIAQHKLLFAREYSRLIIITQVFIPLGGDLTYLNMDNTSYSVLFASEMIRSLEDEIEVFNLWKLKSEKDIQVIKDILARFDINIP